MWKPRRVLGVAALLGLSAVLISGCGGIPRTHYYTVAMPAPALKNDSKASLVLDVERFAAPDVLRDDRILYYKSPTELNYYEYHRWSANPAEMMADLLVRRLRGMDVFSDVRLFPHSGAGDYLLRGRLLNFEELDYEAGGRVRVGLELMLVRTKDHQVVWSDRRQKQGSIQGKGVSSVVNALNTLTAQMLNEVLPELVSSVESASHQGAQ